jgi:hypothetical protein
VDFAWDQYTYEEKERLVPQGSSGKPLARAFFCDDRIVVRTPSPQLDNGEPLEIRRDQFSPKELERIKAPWLKRVITRVLGRRTCVQRADVHPFETTILLPKIAKVEEKEQIWQGILKLLKSTGHQVDARDQRTNQRRAAG